MNYRQTRLSNDFKEIESAFAGHPGIIICNAYGNPPERYIIEYNIKGLDRTDDGIVAKELHRCEIILTSGYPRVQPVCRMLTPVFHPNISPGKICIADHWAAGESLVGIIVRIAEMISYQNYNIKSPLNGEAARWAEDNIAMLPLDNMDFRRDNNEKKEMALQIPVIIEHDKLEQAKTCSNCGTKGREDFFTTCNNGHFVCKDCLITCNSCSKQLCVLCNYEICSVCKKISCEDCGKKCFSCQKSLCNNHVKQCSQCNTNFCENCLTQCKECAENFCNEHLTSHKQQHEIINSVKFTPSDYQSNRRL
jgi:ubiquitin-protein ligase